MFVEKEQDKGKMIVGYQLCKKNMINVPQGRIRIARFTSSFYPQENHGYYGDIYFTRMIKKWKKNKIEKREKQIAAIKEIIIKKNICHDIFMKIIKYL